MDILRGLALLNGVPRGDLPKGIVMGWVGTTSSSSSQFSEGGGIFKVSSQLSVDFLMFAEATVSQRSLVFLVAGGGDGESLSQLSEGGGMLSQFSTGLGTVTRRLLVALSFIQLSFGFLEDEEGGGGKGA